MFNALTGRLRPYFTLRAVAVLTDFAVVATRPPRYTRRGPCTSVASSLTSRSLAMPSPFYA